MDRAEGGESHLGSLLLCSYRLPHPQFAASHEQGLAYAYGCSPRSWTHGFFWILWAFPLSTSWKGWGSVSMSYSMGEPTPWKNYWVTTACGANLVNGQGLPTLSAPSSPAHSHPTCSHLWTCISPSWTVPTHIQLVLESRGKCSIHNSRRHFWMRKTCVLVVKCVLSLLSSVILGGTQSLLSFCFLVRVMVVK